LGRLRWGAGGITLLGLYLGLALISPRFEYGSPFAGRPIVAAVCLMVLAATAYLIVVGAIPSTSGSRRLLIWVLGVGVLMRVVTIASTPILEDDYHRYLWDGAVAAHGINPYRFAPAAVQKGTSGTSVPPVLRDLAGRSGHVIGRVGHPHLRTIYPPVAQAAFAVSHWVAPWSLLGWRLVILAVEAVAVVLLVAILRELRLPVLWATVYWWNPLVVKELYNSAHMDVVLLPFLLGALLLSIRGRPVAASAALAFATATKLWPVVLLPVLIRPVLADPKRSAKMLVTFVLLSALLLWPMLAAGFGGDAGAVAYGQRWEMNDALFMVLAWCVRGVVKLAGADPGSSALLARLGAFGLLAAWTLWILRRPVADGADLCQRVLLVVAALFLLSPTQFPWYYVWFAALLAVRPHWSFLLLTALLPLYYLRFRLVAQDNAAAFDKGIVWIEFAPVWAVLLWEWRRSRRGRPVCLSEATD